MDFALFTTESPCKVGQPHPDALCSNFGPIPFVCPDKYECVPNNVPGMFDAPGVCCLKVEPGQCAFRFSFIVTSVCFIQLYNVCEPGHEKTCLMSYANNKGADQPAHPRSLISAFVVRCLDSVMSLVSVTKISSLMLASVAAQAGLSLTWSETPEDTFCRDEAHV